MKMKTKTIRALTESAVLIAMAVVLSLVKLELPYGGSVTAASMLPIAVIAYRHGTAFGMAAGLIFGISQQLIGINQLSFVTSWQSVLAVIFLDYIIAFTVVGLSGIFRRFVKNRAAALTLGALICSVLRYVCHVISGATVWAGLSIPTEAALGYSFIYNATYMLPETIVLCIAALYVGSNIDLLAEKPVRIRRIRQSTFASLASPLSGALISGAVIYDTIAVFSHLQDKETGVFEIRQIANVNFRAILIVTGIAVLLATALLLCRNHLINKQKTMGE